MLEAFANEQPYQPRNGSALASQYGWTEYERRDTRERWGIWLKKDRTAQNQTPAARHRRFNEFERTLREDAEHDRLIQSPYYYVQKGNDCLEGKLYNLAIQAYNRAINLDPAYSANARFNKAMALLSPQENRSKHQEAQEELEEAKVLITQQYKIGVSSHTLVAQTGVKPGTTTHALHHLDILDQQTCCIQSILDAIESAKEKNWNVAITRNKTLRAHFKDASGNYQLAIDEAAYNGFTHLFSAQRAEPPAQRYGNAAGVAILGASQIAVGVYMTTYGSAMLDTKTGAGLITEGVSDVLAGISAAHQGDFDWAEWRLQKAVSMTVSFACGLGSNGSLIKDTRNLMTGAAKNVVLDSEQKLLIASSKQLAKEHITLELGRGIGQQCINTLVNIGVDRSVMRIIEKEVDKSVSEKVSVLIDHELIKML